MNLKFFFPIILLFIGCGYKPSTIYQAQTLGKDIKAVVNINAKNPKKDAFLKDALHDAVYTIFNANLVDNNENTTIILYLLSSSINPLDYDENGFPILYRSKVKLKAKIIDKNKKVRFYTINGTYDFAVTANSVLNDQIKFDAFKKASINALNKLLAKLTINGVNYDNK
ncbi:MAG TPA: hypothetical protein EYH54_03925 [Nautiliaceae bacterium]|nr:hypothetical protein [Nautiliaceae bacterium]